MNKGDKTINEFLIHNREPSLNIIPEWHIHFAGARIKTEKRFRCLIVDDDEMSLMALSSFLELLNINYVKAYNGKDAIEIIQKEYDQ